MFSDRIFQITLLVSIVIHVLILSQNPGFSLFAKKQDQPDTKVSYVKTPVSETKERAPLASPRKSLGLSLPPPPFIDKENIYKKDREMLLPKAVFTKPALAKPEIFAVRKKITLPPVEMDKMKNPSYISYYQIVREKIRRAAYQNYTHSEIGEVYLSFSVSKEGNLKEVRQVKEKSTSNPYLIDIALKSIQDASPFPHFPQELDYLQLSFNIVISFEIE